MAMSTTSSVGPAEVSVLKLVALEGGTVGDVKISCSDFATRLDVSNQTISRRLQRLERADLVSRETVSDGQWVSVTDAGYGILRAEFDAYREIFDEEPSLELIGEVTSGMGEGRHYISLSGYRRQFIERLGYEPFAGTLNIDLEQESVRRRSSKQRFESIYIDGWEDDDRTYGPARCYPAIVETADGNRYREAHTIEPERTHHDEDKLEVIAPEKLRDVLDLEDGDVITIYVGDS